MDIVSAIVDEWREAIENPNVTVKKQTKKGKKSKTKSTEENSLALNAALKGVITLANAITIDDVLRSRFLRVLRENVQVGDEAVAAIRIDRDDDGNDEPAVLLGPGVEGLAEVHDVETCLTEGRADRRRGRRPTCHKRGWVID